MKQCEIISWFIEQCKGKNVLVYADGSVYNGPVGCGSCASVLFPVSESDEVITQTSVVGQKVRSDDCEVEGIVLGIKMIVQYFQYCTSTRLVDDVYMFCDCDSAIEAVDKMVWNKFPATLRNLRKLLYQLEEMSVSVKLIKLPGHTGILGNVMADHSARDLAYKIFKGDVTAPKSINIHDAYRIALEIAKKSWQRQWDNESTGRYTYNLIPIVGTKVICPSERSVGISYFRMLVHDTMLQDDSYRTGIADTPICECGQENETVEHLLLRCSIHTEARQVMFDCMKDIGFLSKHKRITENLLLALPCDKDISKKDNGIVKESLFEFLSSINRTI